MGLGCIPSSEVREYNEEINIYKKDNNKEGTYSSPDIDLMMEMKEDYPDIFPQVINKLGNNVIYYDQNFHQRPNEIYKDAEMFKTSTKGAFILVVNKDALFLVLKEIVQLKTNCKFDLICNGSSCKEILMFIKENKFLNIFKRCCIYTYPYNYYDIPNKFPLVKEICYNKTQVLQFLNKESNSTPILRTLNLVTLHDYEHYIKKIHFLVAKHYNNFSDSNYKEAIEKVKAFMDNPEEYKFRILNNEGEQSYQKETMLNTLKLYEDIENNYINIIKNYTMERCSIYKDFNYLLLRLNKKGINAFGYFISGLIYSLNKFNKMTGNGEKSNRNLYRGMRLDMTELLSYERYEGEILCFPSFMSTSKKYSAAAEPEGFGGRDVEVETRESEGLFSVVLTIKYNFSNGAVPNGSNIESISQFPTESECLLHPFSFFKVKKVKIDLKNFECDIDLENYSRRSILEEKLKYGYEIDFNKDYIQN